MNIELTARKLYIVSAPAGVGKSTLLRGVKDFVVSSDALRDQIMGNWTDIHGKLHRSGNQDTAVFTVLETIVAARAKERLTTFVDATNLTEAVRLRLANLALQYGQEVEVLMLELPLAEALRRNESRASSIPEGAIRQHYAEFEKTTSLPVRTFDMTQDCTVTVAPLRIPDDTELDIIGDVHGLYDELLQLLEKLGYLLTDDGVPVHPDGRRLLFLGDVVDRGTKSLEVLELVYKAVKAGHYAILGNHEVKLVRFWKTRKTGTQTTMSLSAAETAMAFARLPEKEQDRLAGFLQFLPVTYVWRNFGFVHANVIHYDPIRTPSSDLLYGTGRPGHQTDSDGMYSEHCRAGINKYLLIRGHIEPTGEGQSTHAFSLEDRQAFRGSLVSLDLPRFAKALNEGLPSAFDVCKTTQACDFDFDTHSGQRAGRLKGFQRLSAARLATSASDNSGVLRLWKYSKQVFWNGLWSEDPLLLKARGLVLDIAGNVVVHPFDKVFNFGEEGAGLNVSNDTEVLAPEKLNGFLGVISPHPHKSDLLVTTTGSFDSPFVGYIKDFLPGPVRGRLLQYFHHNEPLTLMFEVVHPEDPHIIEYGPDMHGLWLIGARRLDWDAKVLTEGELDDLAETIGFRRPTVELMTFGEVKARAKAARTEGYMVRDAVTHDYICKLKTPYYLTTKFLGRRGDKKVNFMFKAPDHFKKDVDEEFYPIVDWLVATYELETFKALPEADRLAAVRGYIEEQLS